MGGIQIILVGLLVYAVLECLNAIVVGTILVVAVYRFIRSKIRGSRYIDIPEDLRIAVANELIQVNSELVVGTQPEWQGTSVVRFAISKNHAKEEPGTRLRVDSIGKSLIEVTRISDSTKIEK